MSEETTETTETVASTNKVPDPAKVAETHVKKYGSAEAAIVQLHNENYKFRDTIRELKAKTPEGSVVLTADDASAWSAYRALGKPDEVKKAIKDGSAAIAENQGFKREKEVAEFGRKAGVPTEKLSALTKLAGNAVFGEETKKVNGKDVVTITVKEGDAEPVPFDTYFAEFLPAIKPDGTQEPNKPKGTPRHNGFLARGQMPIPDQPPTREDHNTPEAQLLKTGRYMGLR